MTAWSELFADGDRALSKGDFALAYDSFGQAPSVCREHRKPHLAAHRGMVRAAWGARQVDRVARNVLLLTAASALDWKQ